MSPSSDGVTCAVRCRGWLHLPLAGLFRKTLLLGDELFLGEDAVSAQQSTFIETMYVPSRTTGLAPTSATEMVSSAWLTALGGGPFGGAAGDIVAGGTVACFRQRRCARLRQ